LAVNSEIKIWGWGGLTAFIPSPSAIERFISSVADTLYLDKNAVLFQDEFRRFLETGGRPEQVITLTRSAFDTLTSGLYIFAVDAYGRIRIAHRTSRQMRSSSDSGTSVAQVGHDMLFPGSGVLTAGTIEVARNSDQTAIKVITTRTESYFYSRISPSIREDVTRTSELYLLSLGHLFASLKSMGISLDSVLIRKF
jgi:integrase